MVGIQLEKYDEIECTILGLNLLLTTLSDEVYTFVVRYIYALDSLVVWL